MNSNSNSFFPLWPLFPPFLLGSNICIAVPVSDSRQGFGGFIEEVMLKVVKV